MPKPNNAPQGRKSLMDNRVVSILMALACGLATWLVVTIYIDPQGSTTIRDVPINYANSATTYTNQGLDIVERPDISGVTVRVEGNITSIGKMTSSDIMVYPSYSGVSGAGKVTLRLQARVTNTTDYSGNIKCTVEKPYDTIDVVFDEVSEKTVPVTVDASAVSIADGYMLNKTSAVPAEITLRGPTSELDQISQVVAPVLSDDALADTTTTPSTLELRDENGNTITPQYTTMDSDSANVTLTIYQVRELPLEVDFIGVPNGFDTSSLHYTLSQQKLRVAGPARTVSALESLTVTDFDLAREFEMDRDYQRLIELPAGVVSLDGVTNVTLSFDTTDMASTTLNISNIRLVNVPSNYDMEILSSLVSGVELYGPKDEIEELSAKYGLDVQLDKLITEISVGEQQRTEILKALYHGAELLILDEPSAALTDIEVEGLFAIMHKLIGEGKSIIFISHKMREVLRISDRITILRLGKVVGTVNRADTDGQKLANLMIGKELTESQYEKIDASGAEVVAELDHVDFNKESKHSGLSDLSLKIHAGEIVGVAGVDGNGQTQLAQLITGVLAPDAGEVHLKGKRVAVFDPNGFIEHGVCHVPEDRNLQGLIGDMSIAENLVLKDADDARFSKGHGLLLKKRAIGDYARRMAEKYDVRCTSVDQSVRSLSGGNQQKVILARELENDPALLVMAHPTRLGYRRDELCA